MADLTLVFKKAAYTGGPVDLVFGDDGSTEPTADPSWVEGTHQAATFGGAGVAFYDNKNPRQAGTAARGRFEQATISGVTLESAWVEATRLAAEPADRWGEAMRSAFEPVAAWVQAQQVVRSWRDAWVAADPRGTQIQLVYEQATRRHAVEGVPWGAGAPMWRSVVAPHAVTTHRTRTLLVEASWAEQIEALVVSRHHVAMRSGQEMLAPWGLGRPLPPGLSIYVPPGGTETTPRVIDLNLVFCHSAYAGGPVNLIFGRACEIDPVDPGTIVVPVRSVYMTINNFSLVRLDNGYPIQATSASLALDVDSWTWSVSFSVNGSALPTVERNSSGDPVVARATINGTPIDFLLESISRERTFGSNQLRVQGRGLSAQLDAPYAPTQFFRNTGARTARQLLDDILTLNGESIGWGIDLFQPTDWLVPANVFSHAGSYISAINAVVGSVGGYLQPKDTGQNMDVRLRYPTPSWEWSSATPDIILPSAVTSREAIEWVSKAEYNRVYVSGQEGGVSGPYTRAGTAGDLLAPGVVDPLITHVDAVRQRGRMVISDTGQVANVTLRLPVLSETGIIRPGRMVQYTDGGETRIGMSRSVSVDVSMPTIYQSILVETHV